MSAVVKQSHYSFEEYLMLERSAAIKRELYDGQIYVMTGTRRAYNLITINRAGTVSNSKNSPVKPIMSDIRLKVFETRSYHYQDIVMV